MSKRLLVLGAGESGTGAAVLGAIKGFDVFVSDEGKIADKYKELLNENNISFEEGQHTAAQIINADEIIKSPGIPDKAEIIVEVKNKNIPIIDEIEFAGRFS